MRVAVLPGKLPPGMQLFPPLRAPVLRSVASGLDPGLPQVGVIPFAHLAALAVCAVASHGAQVPLLLFFVGGKRRPIAVEAPSLRLTDAPLDGPPHRPENLRRLIYFFLEKAPHLVIDSATFSFLEGRMLVSRGEKLMDLADAIGLILVQGGDIREVALPPPGRSTR